ncbi:hypothetical protein E8E12_007363 [Didymella heteroderae]|uniref:F-box domain-containing protein n=1 Tax=Didymella heteroderae TaxID=1769908 RepID=A0A9P5C0N7_9PLEO|nr:hypothetical protein E8E12_007363 [Didymella heteroderae]
MGFFHIHRTSSSSSSRSASSTFSAASNYGTSRSSTDSAEYCMTATIKPHIPPTRAPLLDLPFEILQHIASYQDDASASRFSLSSRQICHAVGTKRLSNYITLSPSRFDARDRLEETIERAFPNSWHCAWCDKFHPWSTLDSPTSLSHALQTPCAEYNSYLSDDTGYVLRYHHIRLALARQIHGSAHGLRLSAFSHIRSSSITLFKTPVQTSISHEAKIRDGTFMLHTKYSVLLPSWAASHKNLIGHLWPLLPPVITQHRASEYGHTGLMAALDNVARRRWRVLGAQSCSDCMTDWSVTAFQIPRSVAGEFVRLNVQTWRDLGNGKSPFDTQWRAHGPYIVGAGEYGVREKMSREKGSVREAFESLGFERTQGEETASAGQNEWGKLAYSWQLEKKKEDEKDQEKEWRAMWRFVERRAGMGSGKA